MERSPQACPSLFTALDWFYHGTLVRASEEQLNNLIPHYFPTVVYRCLSKIKNLILLIEQKLFSDY
jgi:hypothetical protein